MIIAAQSPQSQKPFLETDDRRQDQVVLRFIDKDEHITLHLQTDGTILKTHYYPDKPSSTWDEQKIEIARALNYQDLERHGSYIDHQPLSKIDNVNGYHLVGRRIDLTQIQPRQTYYNHIQHTIQVSSDQFMLTFYLFTADNHRNSNGLVIPCNLGEICLELSKS